MGVVLQASPAINGKNRCSGFMHRRTVEVRNTQGSTHRVLKEILQYTRLKGCGRFFIAVPDPYISESSRRSHVS